MKRHLYLLYTILLLLMAISCQDYGNKHYYHELEKIDHRHNRDLARREIMALKDEIASYPDHIKMYHQLLVAELNDEILPYRNLDVARCLVNYYEKSNDRDKLIRSYTVAGRIFANCNDGPKAIEYYHKAENMLAPKDNSGIKNRLYQHLASLLVQHNMINEARRYANRVGYACQEAHDTLGVINALIVLGECNRRSMMPHNEIANLREAQELAQQSGRHDLSLELKLSIAQALYNMRSYQESLKSALSLLTSLPKTKTHRVNALLSQIYYVLGQNDSAYQYGMQVMDDGNSISKRDAHKVLAHLCILRGDKAAAEEHLNHYIELNDELNHIENSEAIAHADAFYHNQKQAEENAQLRSDNQQKQIYIILTIATIIVLLVVLATYIQRHRRKQELMALRIQQLEDYKLSYEKADKKELANTEQSIRQTNIYQRLVMMEEPNHPADEDWQMLADAVNQAYPQFSSRLFSLCSLSSHEYHVCLLLKAGFEPVRIATLTLRSKAAVSTVRSRLYEKAFGKKGSAKDWDEVILTL